MSDSINKRLHRTPNKTYPKVRFSEQSTQLQLTREERSEYIKCYFDFVHPVFPFLVQKEFEEQASDPELDLVLEQDAPFFVLYHAVLAIGSQYKGHGSFDAGRGRSWHLFQAALGRFHELKGPRLGLVTIQFLFAMTPSGSQIAETQLSEAARMAQFARLNKGSAGAAEGAHQRTFWVIYSVEKLSCFTQGRTSVISDDDIGCHIPDVPEAVFGDFNWFLSSVRFGRLLSKAQTKLFSVSATMKSKNEYWQDLQGINDDLETWRMSVPSNFRPRESFTRARFGSLASVVVALRTHLVYHNMVMVLCRLRLKVAETTSSAYLSQCRENFMSSARQVIELTAHLEVEPYTPSLLLSAVPLSAFLSLFQLVINNPTHVQTQDNVTFLQVAAGYFRRLEYATKHVFPYSILPTLAALAQEFVQRLSNPQDASFMRNELLKSPDDNPAAGPGLGTQMTPLLGLLAGPTGSSQANENFDSTFNEANGANGANGANALESLSTVLEDTEFSDAGSQALQGNEIMQFFGTFSDEMCDPMHDTYFGWQ
ncbi:hypothetical protein AYO21_08409 [Fonsecaea monophora]|uniref:Xylanolytic transcriptional activator regulatory domain-containing protein n=1 Tax=Fonsecaea monophora TaxID=254056 RepID=A0A177F1Z6_9EURO|nr:hypothetical protein AYO21_08409 [Fonsecaea monophora]OAG37332.1 hypothetical protein AYO21_08409 [Fonsecaea monophora]